MEPPYFSELLFTARGGNDKIEAKRTKQRAYCSIRRQGACGSDRMKNKKCIGCRKESCDGCSLSPAVKIKTSKETVGEGVFLPEDEGLSGLGIAFDVGTTTIAAMLWDLKERRQLAVRSSVNPQRAAGSDVISRIAYAGKSRENARHLQDLLVRKMDELARDMTQLPVSRVSVVGNTAMCEILLGLSLEGLSGAPFHKEYRGTAERRGSELGFSFLAGAQVLVLPSIEGYVGADALAVYTWVRHQDGRSNVLAVDIGTNGEVLLLGQKNIYACSTAAGPALEGAAVRQGMGAFGKLSKTGSFLPHDRRRSPKGNLRLRSGGCPGSPCKSKGNRCGRLSA